MITSRSVALFFGILVGSLLIAHLTAGVTLADVAFSTMFAFIGGYLAARETEPLP